MAQVAPGAELVIKAAPVMHAMRGRRIALAVSVGIPELRFFQRGIPGVCRPARGSRRAGQRASQLWAVARSLDRFRRWPAAVFATSIVVGGFEYLVHTGGVPVDYFELGFELGLIPRGVDVQLTLRSYETSRIATVVGAIVGDVV